jgi:hypothetical protein
MRISPEQILALLERSLDWAKENPADVDRPLMFAMVEDWSRHGRLEASESAAVSVWIDDREVFGWEIAELAAPDALRASDPACLVFRVIEEDGRRQAVAFVRGDRGLSSKDIANALGHGVYDSEVSRIRREARSAQVRSSESTRKPGPK